MAITAKRGGVTAPHWYETGIPVRLSEGSDDLSMRMTLDSKGGGQTEVLIEIPSKDFGMLMRRMLEADFEKSVASFADAIMAVHKRSAG